MSLFGQSEYGSRVLTAVAGALNVGIIFLALERTYGRAMALATALLVALWPLHVDGSQETRFYAFASLFANLALLAGAWTVARGKAVFAVVACLGLVLAVLSHSLALALLPLIAFGVWIGLRAERRNPSRAVIAVFAVTAIGLAAFVAFYLRPLLSGWNGVEEWGYSPFHSLLATVSMIGWPVALLAGVGVALMLSKRSPQNVYWLVQLAGLGAVVLVVPLVVIYNPWYTFVFGLSAFIAAGYAVARIFELLKPQSVLAAGVWFGICTLLNAPALASYYMDGSRHDLRTAAAFVRDHWEKGDAVASYSVGLVGHYAPSLSPRFPMQTGQSGIDTLAKLAPTVPRLWVIVSSGRSGIDETQQAWLYAHAVHKLHLEKARYDYDAFRVDVYLMTAAAP